MARQSVITRKKRGPPATGKGTLIGVRLQPPGLAALDAWIKLQDDKPSRPEAIRRLVEQALPDRGSKRTGKTGAHAASKLAMREIEPLIDKSEPVEAQERRKRQLIHGPKEFRRVRKDQPKDKI